MLTVLVSFAQVSFAATKTHVPTAATVVHCVAVAASVLILQLLVAETTFATTVLMTRVRFPLAFKLHFACVVWCVQHFACFDMCDVSNIFWHMYV